MRAAVVVVALLVASCSGIVPEPAEVTVGKDSRAWPFMRSPDAREAAISPDGKTVAMVTTVKGHDVIVLWDVDADRRHPLLRFPDPEAQLQWLAWTGNDRLIFSVDIPLLWAVGVRARSHLLYTVKRDGSDLEHLGRKWFGRDDRSKTVAEYCVQVRIQYEDAVLSMLPDDPDHVLLQLQRPQSPSPGVYRLNVTSGRLKRVVAPQANVQQWIADHDGVVRLGRAVSGLNTRILARGGADDDFEVIYRGTFGEGDTFRPVGFSFDPRIIYVASDHEGDRAAAYEYDLETRSFGRKLLEHPTVDVYGSLSVDAERRVVESIDYVVDAPERHFLDQRAAQEQTAIDRALPDRTNRVISESLDRNRVLVESSSAEAAPACYLFDRSKRTMDLLYDERPELVGRVLGAVEAVEYTARDGLRIPAYLTTPPGSSGKNLATVVYPHGGPTSRDTMTFDPTVQFLASLGYAVFQPNFRGSTGFGATMQVSGYQQWGLAMQDDVTDGVRWLIERGTADPERIAIYGASYGGYAALMGLVKTPELFKCGASYAGVTDLVAMLNEHKWYMFDDTNVPTVGSTWSDRSRLNATSPYHGVDQIRAPILIGHGERDPLVHVRQAEMMAAALRSAGKPVELVIYEDEIHGLRMEANRLDFYNRLAIFLEECLAPS